MCIVYISYFVRLASRARGIRITTPTRSEEQMMARLLPYISFLVLLLVMCMAAQAGTGPTPDDEGEQVFPLLSIFNSVYFYFNISSIHSKLIQTSGNEHLYIQQYLKFNKYRQY